MTGHTRHWSEAYSDADSEVGAQYASEEFYPGERIGNPLARSRGKIIRRCSLLALVALGGGWTLLAEQPVLPQWLTTETAALIAALDRKTAPTVERSDTTSGSPPPIATAPPISEPVAAAPPLPAPALGKQVPEMASSVKPSAAPQLSAAVPPSSEADTAEAPAQRLPPPTVDRTDPNQIRAEAVGLHPNLSRVLLERLSPADYRNAGIAIKTALAETPDTDVFVWPRQRKPDLALFQVSFVPGTVPDCRRYVVKVAKDGWLTTALPMEKCGAQSGRPRRE